MSVKTIEDMVKAAISILEPIPEDKWTRYTTEQSPGDPESKRCAMGHLGAHLSCTWDPRNSKLANDLLEAGIAGGLVDANDGNIRTDGTPKVRSLDYLKGLL